jgi:hypothetical protein
MSKKTRVKSVTKTEAPANQPLVIQELRIVAADRSRKDISNFKNALISAESIYYPQRSALYDLYSDITLDGHLTGIMAKRCDAVLNKSMYYEAPGGKRLDEMDDVIQSKVFRDIIKKIMETPGWGLTGFEFIPGHDLAFKEIPRKHIKPKKKLLSLDQHGEEGIPYEGASNLWIIGDDDDLGYLLKCAPYAIYKRGNMADWSQYIEIFGQPVRIVKYDAYDEKTKMELRQVLDESGSSLALMIPKQADFDMKDGKQSNGTGELQEKFKIALDGEMSVIVLGNTESTTSSRKSGYAQSKEHGKQQLEITKSDLKYVLNFLNHKHFVRILQSYGLPVVEGGKFKYEKEIDLQHLKLRMEIDEKVDTKTPIDDDYWYETYGIPKPANYEKLKAEREAAKVAIQQPPVDPDEVLKDPKAPKKKVKKPTKSEDKDDLKANGFLFKLRAILADFFDPAP